VRRKQFKTVAVGKIRAESFNLLAIAKARVNTWVGFRQWLQLGLPMVKN